MMPQHISDLQRFSATDNRGIVTWGSACHPIRFDVHRPSKETELMIWVALIAAFLVADIAVAVVVGTAISESRPAHERHQR